LRIDPADWTPSCVEGEPVTRLVSTPGSATASGRKSKGFGQGFTDEERAAMRGRVQEL